MKVASLKGLDLDLNLKQHEAWLVIKASVEERGAQKKSLWGKKNLDLPRIERGTSSMQMKRDNPYTTSPVAC